MTKNILKEQSRQFSYTSKEIPASIFVENKPIELRIPRIEEESFIFERLDMFVECLSKVLKYRQKELNLNWFDHLYVTIVPYITPEEGEGLGILKERKFKELTKEIIDVEYAVGTSYIPGKPCYTTCNIYLAFQDIMVEASRGGTPNDSENDKIIKFLEKLLYARIPQLVEISKEGGTIDDIIAEVEIIMNSQLGLYKKFLSAVEAQAENRRLMEGQVAYVNRTCETIFKKYETLLKGYDTTKHIDTDLFIDIIRELVSADDLMGRILDYLKNNESDALKSVMGQFGAALSIYSKYSAELKELAIKLSFKRISHHEVWMKLLELKKLAS